MGHKIISLFRQQYVKGADLLLTLEMGQAPVPIPCGVFQVSGKYSNMELSRQKTLKNSKSDSQI